MLVVAEAVKPEDLAAARAARRPVLIVLTKADLAGTGPGGPIAVAATARRGRAPARPASPPSPMVGLLAALRSPGDLDDELVAALRRFVTEPPNLTSVDAFVDDPHPVRPGRARPGCSRVSTGSASPTPCSRSSDGCDAETAAVPPGAASATSTR